MRYLGIVFLFIFTLYSNTAYAIVSGTKTSGSITAGQPSNHTVSGSAGENFLIKTSSTIPIYINVKDANGNSVRTGTTNVYYSFPADGTYTIALTSNLTASGPYTIFYTAGKGPTSGGALSSGSFKTDTLETNGIVSFQFTTTEPDQGFILSAISAYGASALIFKPDGTHLTTMSGGRLAYNASTPGTYTIIVQGDNYSNSGEYKIGLVLGAGSVSSGSLTSGQSTNQLIDVGGLISYNINGTQGDDVFIHTYSPSFNSYISIYKPDGTRNGTSLSRIKYNLPVTGTYTVVIYGYYHSDTGLIRLDYYKSGGGVSSGSLQSGSTKTPTLLNNGLLSFQLTVPTDMPYFRLHSGASYAGSTKIGLYKADGTHVTSANPNGRLAAYLPAGNYSLVAYSAIADTGPLKAYPFLSANTVSEGALVSGSTRQGQMDYNGLKSYTFSATQGHSLTLTPTGSAAKYTYLYKPDGSYWRSSTNNTVISDTVPVTGTYSLIVYPNGYNSTGPYSLTLATTPPPDAPSDPKKDGVFDPLDCAGMRAGEDGSGAASAPGSGGEPSKEAGNPINFDIGYKKQVETDYSAGALSFTRTYRSDSLWTDNTIGQLWRHNFARTLSVTASAATIVDGSGAEIKYTLTGGNWAANDPDIVAKFQSVSGGYVYTLPDNTAEYYDSNKRLTRIAYMGGGALNLAYDSNGKLTSITDENNRTLALTYSGGRVATLVTPDGTYSYSYDANGNLTLVTQPDTKTRQYHYEKPSLINALTGITDEKGVRYATYDYNAAGKAILSKHAGDVDSYSITYNTDGSTTVTNPLGKQTKYYFKNIQGLRRIVQVDGVASTSCPASNRYYNYDTLGRLLSKTDWEGNTTRYTRNALGQITQTIAAAGTAEEQITNISYESTFNMPDLITEPGKTTDYDYDSYGRIVTVSVTDTATLETRITTYAYKPNSTDSSGNTVIGRLAQIDGPRTDVSDITTYDYDANLNLTKVTNALGQISEITARDAAGRPTSFKDPNNVVTTLVYDVQGRLDTSTTAPGTSFEAITNYDYDANGNLTKVTLPNGVVMEYSYDNAQRLTGMKDALSNTTTYTLDAAGNITGEQVHNSMAVLKYSHTQVFDELSRIIRSIGAASQTSQYAYDKNSNLKTYTDARNYPSSYAYDALQRLVTSTDALNGVATLGYNERDEVTSLKDPRNNTTTYTRNGFGDIISEVSPDRGTTSYTVDKAGNITQRVDARSIVSNYTYDALDRLLTIAYPSETTLNVVLTWDDNPTPGQCGTSKGRLCRVVDSAGTSDYTYNTLGQLTQVKDIRGSLTLTTAYTYDKAGNITSITLPSGRVITYTLNGNAQVTGVSAPVGGAGVSLASSITYLPYGPMNGITYGNGLVFTGAFDADYNPTARAVSGLYSNTYVTDANGNVTQKGNLTYGYDALNRVNAENAPAATSYTYDANSNRLTKVMGTTTTTTVPAASNKISAVGAEAYTYDAAGNITGEGARTYIWNAAGQMKEAKVSGTSVGTYTYDSQNQRSKKVAGGATVYYIYGAGGLLYGEYDAAGALIREYVYLNAEPLAQIEKSGGSEVLTYLHTDHLGTPRYGTDTAGVQSWIWNSDAFGNGAPTGTATVNLRMPGQYYDAETDLFYNWNRYYNPATGRYITVDPIGLEGGLNTFLYTDANPVMYTDPEGLVIPIVLGAGVGVTAGVTLCLITPECINNKRLQDLAPNIDKGLQNIEEGIKNIINNIIPPRGLGVNNERVTTRTVPKPERKSGKWTANCRADCNDNMLKNCPDANGNSFSFGTGTGSTQASAKDNAKYNAQQKILCQPKHTVACQCTSPGGQTGPC